MGGWASGVEQQPDAAQRDTRRLRADAGAVAVPSGGDCTGGGLCSSIRDTLRTRGVGLWRGEALALDPDAVPATGLLVKLSIVHRHAKPPEHSIARILGHPYELLLVPFLLDLDTVGEGLELGVGFRLEFGEVCIV